MRLLLFNQIVLMVAVLVRRLQTRLSVVASEPRQNKQQGRNYVNFDIDALSGLVRLRLSFHYF